MEMHEAFESVGLTVAYDPQGLIGRGLYMARRTDDDGLPSERHVIA